MLHIGYLAAGIIIVWVMWIATGYIRNDFTRTILRAVITAISVTPAVVAGHGVGVLPAFLLLSKEGYFWWGAIPIISVAVILLIVFFSVANIRKGYIQSRITWREVLVRPAKFKLFLIGLIIVLLKAEFREALLGLWALQMFMFVIIFGLHFFLCYTAQRDTPQPSAWLPVWFVIPHALVFYPSAILYYFSGLAGCFAGKRDYYLAYLTGSVGTGMASLMAAGRLYNAIKYAEVQHITIQGGIAGTFVFFTVIFIAFISCLIGLRKYYVANKHQHT